MGSNGIPQTTTEHVTEDRSVNLNRFDSNCVFCKSEVSEQSHPLLLPCLHTACRDCVFSSSPQPYLTGSKVICSDCQDEFDQHDAISHLYLIEQLKEGPEAATGETSKNVTCTSCDDHAVSTGFCTDCQEWLCDECIKAHTRVRITKDHVVKLIEDLEGESVVQSINHTLCKTHTRERLKLYCETCEKLTCRDCQLQEHREHTYQFLESTCQQQKMQILHALTDFREHHQRVKQESIFAANYSIEFVKNEIRIRNEIKKAVMRYMREVQQRKNYLTETLHTSCDIKRKEYRARDEDLIALGTKLRLCENLIKVALNRGSELAVAFTKTVVTSRVNRLLEDELDIQKAMHMPEIRFVFDSNAPFKFCKQFGTLSQETYNASQNYIESRLQASASSPQVITSSSTAFDGAVHIGFKHKSPLPNSIVTLLTTATPPCSTPSNSTTQMNLHGVGKGSPNQHQSENPSPQLGKSSQHSVTTPTGTPVEQEAFSRSSQQSNSQLPSKGNQTASMLSSVATPVNSSAVCASRESTSSALYSSTSQETVGLQDSGNFGEKNGGDLEVKKSTPTPPSKASEEVPQRRELLFSSARVEEVARSSPKQDSSVEENSHSNNKTSGDRTSPDKELESLTAASLKPSRESQDQRASLSEAETCTDDNLEDGQEDPNEDWCAVCHDGGELLCCNSCPKVFHLQCYVPCLETTPKEDWTCCLCLDVLMCKIPKASGGYKRKSPVGLGGRELLICERILLELFCHELSAPFHVMTGLGDEAYFTSIEKPMDLGTVRNKLAPFHFNHYIDIEEFVSDVRLIFQNCAHNKHSETRYKAKKLEEFFHGRVRKFLPQNIFSLKSAFKRDDGVSDSKKQKLTGAHFLFS